MLTYKLGTSAATYKGAFFLNALDERMEKSGLFYVRFMDDILVLAPTRWKLRRAVRAVNEVLGSPRMEKHPEKTFIGPIERGFDFLGYHFNPAGLTVAHETVVRFVARATRLYEQEPEEAFASTRLGLYVRRWIAWAGAGIGEDVGPVRCLVSATFLIHTMPSPDEHVAARTELHRMALAPPPSSVVYDTPSSRTA